MKSLSFNSRVNSKATYSRDVLIVDGAEGITLQAEKPAGKIDLSNGTGGTPGKLEYVAPNGVLVTCSSSIYSSDNSMVYLFDGLYNTIGNQTKFFMTSSSSSALTKLTFDFSVFQSDFLINEIRIRPRATSDAISNYRILTSPDNVNFTEVIGLVTNVNAPIGTENTHLVNITDKFVQLELTRETNIGATLDEIEFYSPTISLVQGKSYVASTNELSEEALFLKQLTCVEPVENVPQNTVVRYLISFDGKKTWETFRQDGAALPTPSQNPVISSMRSNDYGGMVASASSSYSSAYDAFKAFTHPFIDSTDTWRSAQGVPFSWLQIQLDKSRKVTQYSISALISSTSKNAYPVDWVLQGSNNGVDFTDIHTVTDEPVWNVNETRFFKVDSDNVGDYIYYRLYISKNGPGASYAAIANFGLMEGYAENWEKVELSEIASKGMTSGQLRSINPLQWQQKHGVTRINMAVSLQSFNGTAFPSVKEVVLHSGSIGMRRDERYATGKRSSSVLQGSYQDSILQGEKFYGVNSQGEAKVNKEQYGYTIPIESIGLVETTLEGFYQPSLYGSDNLAGFTTSARTYEGITMSKQVIGIQNSKVTGFYQPSIYFGMDLPGYLPINRTHVGIRYGVGWEEKPPFKPRVLPNDWHPAVFNGQKNNSQPLNE